MNDFVASTELMVRMLVRMASFLILPLIICAILAGIRIAIADAKSVRVFEKNLEKKHHF
jgi:Na+/H+-dicarboxylate symporter